MAIQYKTMMSKVEKMLAQPSSTQSAGLLSPTKGAKQPASTSPEAAVAKYVALIRKQRQELMK